MGGFLDQFLDGEVGNIVFYGAFAVFSSLILFKIMVGVIRMEAHQKGDVSLLFLQAYEFWDRLLNWA